MANKVFYLVRSCCILDSLCSQARSGFWFCIWQVMSCHAPDSVFALVRSCHTSFGMLIDQVRLYFILYVDWSGQVMLLILHVDWLGQVILCIWFCIATGQVRSYFVRSGHAPDSVFYWPSLSYCKLCTLTDQVCHISDSAFWLIRSVIFLILHFDWSGLSYFWFCILINQVCHISDSLFWLIRSIIFLILHFDWSGVSYFWFYVLTDQVCHTSIFWLMRSLSH